MAAPLFSLGRVVATAGAPRLLADAVEVSITKPAGAFEQLRLDVEP